MNPRKFFRGRAIGLIVLLVLVALSYLVVTALYQEASKEVEVDGQMPSVLDYKNATYKINGEEVSLIDGVASTLPATGSATNVITQYFGNSLIIDLNADGVEDVAFIVTQETGGSGVFYYAVGAIKTEVGYVGTEGYLLGDRVAPQSTAVSQNPRHKNVVVFNYVDRALDEPMTSQPSIGKSAYLKLVPDTNTWAVVEADFAGEANPDIMTLDMQPWTWIKTTYNNDTEITPKQATAFVVNFKTDNSVTINTDCNNMMGNYSINDNVITFASLASTKMFCPDSQEQEFGKMLGEVQSFFFTSHGELVLELKYDSGSMIFR